MKLIPLIGKYGEGKFAQVDDHWYEFLMQWKWYAAKSYNKFYAVRSVYLGNNKEISIKMHRVILGLTDSRIYCDHRDGDGLNNLEENLRKATPKQNAQNTKSHKDAKVEFKGVTRQPGNRKRPYAAIINHNGKNEYIGAFKCPINAAIAFNEKAVEYQGEFAYLNKIPEGFVRSEFPCRAYPVWTDSEIEIFTRLYPTEKTIDVALILGKSPRNLFVKAHSMKLKKINRAKKGYA